VDVLGRQTIYELFRDRELQASTTGAFSTVTPGVSTQVSWRQDYQTNNTILVSHQSIVSLGAIMPAGLNVRMEGTYNHLLDRVESISLNAIKRFPNNIRVSFSYFKIPPLGTYNIGIRVQYYFPFFRAEVGASTGESGQYDYNSAASGSISFDPRVPNAYFDNRPTFVGFGGLVVHPFFDANGNGVPDVGEESIEKGKVYIQNISRGVRPYAASRNQMSLSRLPAYEEYDVYLDPKGLESPLWTPTNGSFRILSEPNSFKSVNIAVVAGGTLRGAINIRSAASVIPAEGITVTMVSIGVDEPRKRKYTASTFSTGEFEFFAIPPGDYKIELDAAQLEKLAYRSEPPEQHIVVSMKPEGDLIENINFTLTGK
jgi:hypothetical protein